MKRRVAKLLGVLTAFTSSVVCTYSATSCSNPTDDKFTIAGDTSNLVFTKIGGAMVDRAFTVQSESKVNVWTYKTDNLPEGIFLSKSGILYGSNTTYCAGQLHIYLTDGSGEVCSNILTICYKTIIQAKYLCHDVVQGSDITGLVLANSKDSTIDSGSIKVKGKLAEMLAVASNKLKESNPNYRLHLTSGYRSYTTQCSNFLGRFASDWPGTSAPSLNPTDIPDAEWDKIQYTHEAIAYPYCAGHPTGGAVDIYIYENNSDIGFGKHGRETYPTYDIAPGDDLNNRLLLLDVMTFAGFTPYYGEFWHFMYGDTEWAAANGKKNAIYKQQEYS